MSNHYPELFTPTHIRKLKIKNKLSMAPMGPVGYSDSDGTFSQKGQDYYVERAKGGIGLIITGICSVDFNIEKMVKPSIPCPTLNPIAFIHAATQMNERIHAYDSKIFLQLTAGLGRSAIIGFVGDHVAPSPQENRWNPTVKHRELSIEEIQNIIKQFATSAFIAKQSGFDGVEVHAVHEGYLLDQFAISFFNKRTDAFGGSLENRLRISTEIVKAIKSVCGQDFPVSLRYSLKSFMKGLRQGALPGETFTEAGKDIEEGIEAAKLLVAAGYDALNVDVGTYDSWYWNHPPMYFEDGMYRDFGKILKENVDVPIILAGRMDNPEMAVEALKDSCDIISYGRPLLSDSEYAEKVRTGRLDEIRPCLSCHEGCLGRISKGPICCAVNPACGRENIYGLTPATTKKNVLVVGGGIAGMEVARVCALRGYDVTLCEKSDKLGGNLIPGAVPEFKRNDRKLVKWYNRQLDLLKVRVNMNTAITKASISKYNADIVVVATGSSPIVTNLGGTREILTASEVLLGAKSVGKNVVMVGGGLVGCETALWLAEQGHHMTIVEMAPHILGGPHSMPFMNYDMLKDLLAFNNVKVYTGTQVSSVHEDRVCLTSPDGEINVPADTVITAIGYKSDNKLFDELQDLDIPIYNIGDSRQVHNIMYAIWDAYEIAREM